MEFLAEANKFLHARQLVSPCIVTPSKEASYESRVTSTCYLNELLNIALFVRLSCKDDLYLKSLEFNYESLSINQYGEWNFEFRVCNSR